jgi:sugar/nucleoside kinase (ribokinase family)
VAEGARLVHVGNVVADLVMYVPALPEAGGDVLASDSRLTAGGAFNAMVSACRQGLPAVYGGMHGTGPFADLCRERLAAAGIELAQHRFPDLDSGFTVALVDPSGERTFATSPGAEARLDAAALAALDIRPADLVAVSGYGLAYPSNGPALADWMSTVDATVIVDPGPLVADIPEPVLRAALDRADWWTCNEREARVLADRLDTAGRVGTLIRSGARGCVVALRGRTPVTVPAFEVTAVDTNGAGDAHLGAFAAALADGLDPVDAVVRANAAAAIAVTRFGPATAPNRTEVDQLVASRPR